MKIEFANELNLDDESWDIEEELFEVISELAADERQLLMQSSGLPECIYDACNRVAA